MDEKLFAIEQAHNRHNDWSWCAEAPGTSVIIGHRKIHKSVIVWARIFDNKSPFVFVDEGVKIYQNVYRRDILNAVVVPWARRHFTRLQDSVPAHRARATQEWCKAYFQNAITSAEWPPYSPYLN